MLWAPAAVQIHVCLARNWLLHCAVLCIIRCVSRLSLPPSFNEPPDAPLSDPTRRGFEQLLRKLARLPRTPAVIVLHHYAWHFAVAEGVQAGQYQRGPEQHLSTLAQVKAGCWACRVGWP